MPSVNWPEPGFEKPTLLLCGLECANDGRLNRWLDGIRPGRSQDRRPDGVHEAGWTDRSIAPQPRGARRLGRPVDRAGSFGRSAGPRVLNDTDRARRAVGRSVPGATPAPMRRSEGCPLVEAMEGRLLLRDGLSAPKPEGDQKLFTKSCRDLENRCWPSRQIRGTYSAWLAKSSSGDNDLNDLFAHRQKADVTTGIE
jgi:hypothetical protein